MPDSFGARLRQQREQQQIALSSIAEQTKIKVSLLEELERDDFSHWPVGIFRRSFIRGYAQAIGLDPAPVLVEFLALYPDPTDIVTTPEIVPSADEGQRNCQAAHAPEVSGRIRDQLAVPGARGCCGQAKDREDEAVAAPVAVAPSFTPPPSPFEPDLPPSSQSELEPPPSLQSDIEPPPASPFEPDLLAAAQLCTGLSRSESTQRAAITSGGGRQNSRRDRCHRLGLGCTGGRVEAGAGARLFRQAARTASAGEARRGQRDRGGVSIG